jgi:SpoVK/Ycf46/Vps4 family AAA+-type ATPase
MPEVHDLGLMIDSNIPIVVIETAEELRAIDTITRLSVSRNIPMYSWSITEGIQRLGFGFEMERDDKCQEPEAILEHIKKDRTAAIYVLCDFHPFLADSPKNIRLIKDIAMRKSRLGHTLILLSHSLTIPPEIRSYSARLQLRLPQPEHILAIVREEASNWSRQNGRKVKTDYPTLQQLVKNLSGLTYDEVRRLCRSAIIDDGAITESDLPEVNKAKFELMDMSSVLTYEFDTTSFQQVGGLHNLKQWLQTRDKVFNQGKDASNIDPPKGILLLGVQGGGKSLAAKAVAGAWHLPLLRMDVGSLYNKFFGETEKNLRKALQLAELMSPCVLWMDEIEKAFGQDAHDQGVSQRMLGTLLTWLAEKTHPVFVVATANKAHILPPELIRKGRLDEIFFVDFPDEETRATIFRIHLQKRKFDPDLFTLSTLTRMTEGFSGAEIEQAVVSAIYSAEARAEKLTHDHIVHEISMTQPLSVVMAEDIASLRAWAKDRTVKA